MNVDLKPPCLRNCKLMHNVPLENFSRAWQIHRYWRKQQQFSLCWLVLMDFGRNLNRTLLAVERSFIHCCLSHRTVPSMHMLHLSRESRGSKETSVKCTCISFVKSKKKPLISLVTSFIESKYRVLIHVIDNWLLYY